MEKIGKDQIKQVTELSSTGGEAGRHRSPSGLTLRRARRHVCAAPAKSDLTVVMKKQIDPDLDAVKMSRT